jgi:hypothetical protein
MDLKRLDVLVHIPAKKVRNMDPAFFAIALQCNLSALGETPEKAVEKVVRLTIDHLEFCRERKIDPLNLAEPYLLAVFHVGEPMTEAYADVCARLSQHAMRVVQALSPDIRSICRLQDETGVCDVREFANISGLMDE